MIKVLHYIRGFKYGGIESLFLSWFKYIDKSKYKYELLIRTQEESDMLNEYVQMGGVYYRLDKLKVHKLCEFGKSVKRFFLLHNDYDILHCHGADPYVMHYARKNGIKNIIFHAHTSRNDSGLKGWLWGVVRNYQIKKYVTDAFACSKEAAYWAYNGLLYRGKPITIIPNGIDVERFKFDVDIRRDIRYEHGWNNFKIVGFVGRLTEAKNPFFIMEVYKKLVKRDKRVKCVIVGNGSYISEMKNGLTDDESRRIIFMGNRTDTDWLMQGMDCMILPSVWEGFPVVLVEAQTSGLPCVISDSITETVDITHCTRRLSLSESIDRWTEAIIKSMQIIRTDNSEVVREAGYDIKDASVLHEAYERIIDE